MEIAYVVLAGRFMRDIALSLEDATNAYANTNFARQFCRTNSRPFQEAATAGANGPVMTDKTSLSSSSGAISPGVHRNHVRARNYQVILTFLDSSVPRESRDTLRAHEHEAVFSCATLAPDAKTQTESDFLCVS